MIRHHNVTTPFALRIKAEYELNIYFVISYNFKTFFYSHVRCLMSRSERSSAQKRRKDGSFSADYCDVLPTTFFFLFSRDYGQYTLSARVNFGAAKTICG